MSMPDYFPLADDDEDSGAPWDPDGGDDSLGNYDYGESGLGDD